MHGILHTYTTSSPISPFFQLFTHLFSISLSKEAITRLSHLFLTLHVSTGFVDHQTPIQISVNHTHCTSLALLTSATGPLICWCEQSDMGAVADLCGRYDEKFTSAWTEFNQQKAKKLVNVHAISLPKLLYKWSREHNWSSFVEPPQSMCTDGCGPLPLQTTGKFIATSLSQSHPACHR